MLNVGGLLYLDSSGVGELVNCYMSVIKQGGEMKVVGLTPKVEEILKITQLYRVFQEFHDEEDSAAEFPRNPKKRKRLDARKLRAQESRRTLQIGRATRSQPHLHSADWSKKSPEKLSQSYAKKSAVKGEKQLRCWP